MPQHIEDSDNIASQPGHVAPDSQSESLCTGSTILILTKRDPRGMVHLMRHMRHTSKKIQNLHEQMILLISQVS